MPFASHPRIRRLLWVLSLVFLIVGCDQLVKVGARDLLVFRSFSYLGGAIRLQLVENAGGFLSLGAGLSDSLRFVLLTLGVAIFVLAALVIVVLKPSLGRRTSWALVLVSAGGMGNLIDRVLKGSVTDYISIGFWHIRTGVFNVADVAVMVGVGLLFLDTLLAPKAGREG